MNFYGHNQGEHFRELWNSVRVERDVHYSLFTFGDSELPYFLVLGAGKTGATVSIRQGEVHIARPRIITPDNIHPEFRNFFEDQEEDEGMIEFLLARSAAFSNLKLSNQSGPERIVTDTVDEAVARLAHQLDEQEEDRVAILSAPHELQGVAVLRYASERVWASASDNVNELRERGFLP